MAYLIGSADTSTFVSTFGYRPFAIPAAWHNNSGLVASTSGNAGSIKLSINAWDASLNNIRVGLFDNTRTLIFETTVASTIGTGFVSIPVTGTVAITSGNTYYLSIINEADFPLTLDCKTGDDLKYHDTSTYAGGFVSTLPTGITSTQNEYYWAVEEAAPSRSITNIDGDNDVQAGQTNITVTTVGMDSAPTVKTATLGGESLTVVSAGETSWVVSVPLHIDLEWGATHELALTDDTGTVTLAGVTLSAPTGWETVAFTTAPNPATTESFYEYAQTDTGLGGAGYTMLAGDILAWETQTGLTIDGQTIPQVDPPSTVSGSYKIFKDATKTWASVSTFTINDLGFSSSLGVASESDSAGSIAPLVGIFSNVGTSEENFSDANSIQPSNEMQPGVYPVTVTAVRDSDGLTTIRTFNITILGTGVSVVLGSASETDIGSSIIADVIQNIIANIGIASENSISSPVTASFDGIIYVNIGNAADYESSNSVIASVAGSVSAAIGTAIQSDSASVIVPGFSGDIYTLIGTASNNEYAFTINIAGQGWEIELQRALYAALKSDENFIGLVNGVYDSVPQKTDFPYVTIGEASHTEFDTDTELGHDATITVHTWSRHRGRSETKEIQGAIYTALHRANLPIVGYNLITCDFVSSQTFDDSDGKTRHGVQEFRVLMSQF